MRLYTYSLALLLLSVVVLCQAGGDEQQQQQQQQQQQENSEQTSTEATKVEPTVIKEDEINPDVPLNENDQFPEEVEPKVVDFAKYKQMFHKRYNSFVEEVSRSKLFVVRAMKVANSWMKYKMGLSDYYSNLNEMSDWTPEERAQLKPHALPAGLAMTNSSGVADSSSNSEKLNRQKRGLTSMLKKATGVGTPSLSDADVISGNHIDLRKTNCFSTPSIHQGGCESCYAFAAIAIYEYLYCRAYKKKVKFSKQYLVDCGHKFGLAGCEGGRFIESAKFANAMGFELESEYPYEGFSSRGCPHDSAGYDGGFVKASSDRYIETRIDDWDYWLRKKVPLYVSIGFGDSFMDYGGGVHPATDCAGEDTHAMVLVGMGNENGKDYWLLRNSYGDSWGIRGYYKMSKSTPCIARGGVSYTADAFHHVSKSAFRDGSGAAVKHSSSSSNYNDDYDYDESSSSSGGNSEESTGRKPGKSSGGGGNSLLALPWSKDKKENKGGNSMAIVPKVNIGVGDLVSAIVPRKPDPEPARPKPKPQPSRQPEKPMALPAPPQHEPEPVVEPEPKKHQWDYPASNYKPTMDYNNDYGLFNQYNHNQQDDYSRYRDHQAGQVPYHERPYTPAGDGLNYGYKVVHDSWGGNDYTDTYNEPPPVTDLKYVWPF